jgi:hypothetical protein
MSSPLTPSPDGHAASAALIREIEHVTRLHHERQSDPALAAALERIGAWQARRLRQTYADLAPQSRYAEAIVFFETDLYGGGDFAQRDADLARVVPILVRMLPANVIASIAQAMELNAMSQELDRALLAQLPNAAEPFTVADYCVAYRRMDNRPARERQIRLLAAIGAALDGFVRKPLIRAALAMMRQPARLAGVSVLHDFLDRGFHAFRRMHGAELFLATIVNREMALMESILGGETAPFADPTNVVATGANAIAAEAPETVMARTR